MNLGMLTLCEIENEDHHCVWLNNCVGKRNYATFFTFIVSCVLLCCYAIAFSLAHVLLVYTASEESFQASLLRTPISFFVAIFCFVLLLPVGCLTGYHCFLVMRGVTTHEQVCFWLSITFYMLRRTNNRISYDPIWPPCRLKTTHTTLVTHSRTCIIYYAGLIIKGTLRQASHGQCPLMMGL